MAGFCSVSYEWWKKKVWILTPPLSPLLTPPLALTFIAIMLIARWSLAHSFQWTGWKVKTLTTPYCLSITGGHLKPALLNRLINELQCTTFLNAARTNTSHQSFQKNLPPPNPNYSLESTKKGTGKQNQIHVAPCDHALRIKIRLRSAG